MPLLVRYFSVPNFMKFNFNKTTVVYFTSKTIIIASKYKHCEYLINRTDAINYTGVLLDSEHFQHED